MQISSHSTKSFNWKTPDFSFEYALLISFSANCLYSSHISCDIACFIFAKSPANRWLQVFPYWQWLPHRCHWDFHSDTFHLYSRAYIKAGWLAGCLPFRPSICQQAKNRLVVYWLLIFSTVLKVSSGWFSNYPHTHYVFHTVSYVWNAEIAYSDIHFCTYCR